MKKAVTIILIFTMLIVFAGCSNTNEQDDRIEILESQVTSMSTDLNNLIEYLNQLQAATEQLETEASETNYYANDLVRTVEVSADTYNSLSPGSSYETVVYMIGDYGILKADVSANGSEIKTFKWNAEPVPEIIGVEYIYCKFEDDKLVEKWSDIKSDTNQSDIESDTNQDDNSRPFASGRTVNVSKSIYDKIEIGSSYETVYSLIGDYGILASKIETDKLIETIQWNASDFYYFYCKFEDDKLVEKWFDEFAYF